MFLPYVLANRELMMLNYSHSFTWLPWTPLRPAPCRGSVVLTTSASHKLRPSEWRERSVPSSHPDSRISIALSVKGTETDSPSSTWRYDFKKKNHILEVLMMLVQSRWTGGYFSSSQSPTWVNLLFFQFAWSSGWGSVRQLGCHF